MNIEVIGMGSIGRRHAHNLIALGHKVRGIDPDKSRQMFGFSGKPDAYVVAAPTADHLTIFNDIKGNDRPIFMEKPIAAQADPELRKVAMVGYNLRFHPCVKRARELLPSIGKPLWACFTCAQFNDRPVYRRDGVVLNWSHEIDLALYLLGPAKVLCAADREDMADIVLEHDSGCRSTIHLDYVTNPEIRGFFIAADQMLSANLKCRYIERDFADTESFEVTHDAFAHDYMDEMRAFVDRINGKETIGATGEEGLAALEICLAAKKKPQ